jgi:hypothetical protein
MLVPFGRLLLACDSVRRVQGGESVDLVLGVDTPTKILANSLITRSGAKVLDLGTECGTLALVACRSALSVTASDVNPRALGFTEFNAALNGIANLQTRLGDRFEPVEEEEFDLIACNPPFFLTPKARLLYTDNPAELDSFVEELARMAPRFLKQGGFFQMLCEWVELEDKPWRDRLKGWFKGSGCDILILKAYEMGPVNYVLTRAGESASLYGDASEERLLEHIEYFRGHCVGKVFGGLITMRRRTGENWLLF